MYIHQEKDIAMNPQETPSETTRKTDDRKPYMTPAVETVALKPKELMVNGCKSTSGSGPIDTGGCNPDPVCLF